jgi:hypothetical protein
VALNGPGSRTELSHGRHQASSFQQVSGVLVSTAKPFIASSSIEEHAAAIGCRLSSKRRAAIPNRAGNRVLECLRHLDVELDPCRTKRHTRERYAAKTRDSARRLLVVAVGKTVARQRVGPNGDRTIARLRARGHRNDRGGVQAAAQEHADLIEIAQAGTDGHLIKAAEMCDVVMVVTVSNLVPWIDVPISRRPASVRRERDDVSGLNALDAGEDGFRWMRHPPGDPFGHKSKIRSAIHAT